MRLRELVRQTCEAFEIELNSHLSLAGGCLVPFPGYAQCPAELNSTTYGYGNTACSKSYNIRQIIGTLDSCPAPLIPYWDSYGRTTCEDQNGQAVTELIK